MTLENARVLIKHRRSLGKDVSDIERRYPELREKEVPKEVKDGSNNSPRRKAR